MKILYLIGNGFDLNLNLKTKFVHFLKYYCRLKKSDTTLVNNIEKDILLWSDLEISLGEFTYKINSSEDFINIYNNLQESLSVYLSNLDAKFDFNNFNSEKFFKDLAFPNKNLLPSDIEKFKLFQNRWNYNEVIIDIITFNYTKSIEKITGYSNEKLDISKRMNDSNYASIFLNEIVHVHGTTDRSFVLGVNDISQIKNKKFRKNIDIREILIKYEAIQSHKSQLFESCKQKVENADLICFFGLSFGKTDRNYWELVGEQLKRGCNIIIFGINEDKTSPLRPNSVKLEKEAINKFFLQTKLNKKDQEKYKSNVIGAVNTKMFDLIDKI